MPATRKPTRPDYAELAVRTRGAWRRWLQRNHARSRGVWFVHFKKASGQPGVSYDECVEEALCFGWIDSTIRTLDEDRYAHLLTPRSNPGNWSELNKRRVAALIECGRMTAAGLAVYRPELAPAGKLHADLPVAMPDFLAAALKRKAAARRTFEALSRTARRHYIDWLAAAKRDDTRARRLDHALALLAAGQKLRPK